MPRSVRRCVAALVATTAVAGCSYSSGTLSSPSTTAPRPGAPVTASPLQGPVVGTLPPITQPGQTAAPRITAPPETVPASLPVTPADGATSTSTKPAKPAKPTSTTTPPTTQAAATATSAAAPTAAKGPGVVGVQAGAYSDPASAAQGVAILAEKGFPGFTVSGTGPYRLVRVPLSKQVATALVAKLADAGWPALAFTRSA